MFVVADQPLRKVSTKKVDSRLKLESEVNLALIIDLLMLRFRMKIEVDEIGKG